MKLENLFLKKETFSVSYLPHTSWQHPGPIEILRKTTTNTSVHPWGINYVKNHQDSSQKSPASP